MSWVTVVYLYKETLPERREFHCTNCTRLIGVFNRGVMAIMPSIDGLAIKEIPAGVTVFEHKCRGCSAIYKIYFQ